MFSVTREVTITFGQCDPAGIVYYPNYFDMFNSSTDVLISQALAIRPAELISRYAIIPMVDARNVYHRPSRHGDVVRIESFLVKLGRSSFHIHHRLFVETGELGVEGFEIRVWTVPDRESPTGLSSKAIPDEVRAKLMAVNPR